MPDRAMAGYDLKIRALGQYHFASKPFLVSHVPATIEGDEVRQLDCAAASLVHKAYRSKYTLKHWVF
jgi:hypothetical protein